MPAKTKKADPSAKRPVRESLAEALALLDAKATRRDLDNLARFGITATRPFGVSMANMKTIAKRFGRDHALAEALWEKGRYEARMLATLVDEPESVTPAQMNRWCRDFDNWAICDTACFCLFDRTPHAWKKVAEWSDRGPEFEKRAAFALLASLALHDKTAADALFLECLPLVEREAGDDRNFVKKAVSWALRGVGRRNATLHAAALPMAERLAASGDPAARWVGKDALRDLEGRVVAKRLAKKSAPRS